MSNNPPEEKTFNIDPSAGSGALYQPIYGTRKVNQILIQENELDMLGLLNNQISFCFAVIGVSIGTMLSVIWEMAITTEPTTTKVGYGFLLIGGAIILIFGGIAAYLYNKRSNYIKRIIAEMTMHSG